jgi:integrase
MPKRGAGEGTILTRKYKRKDGKAYKRYFARITTHGNTRKDGPMRERYEDALKDKAYLLQRYFKGRTSEQAERLLRDYIGSWLQTVNENGKYHTHKTYKSDLEKHVLPRLGHLKLRELEPHHIQEMLQQVLATSQAKGNDGRSVVRKCKAALRTALEDAVKQFIIDRNPCYGTKVPKERPNRTELWTHEEVRRFLEVASTNYFYPHIYTALTTGMREGELLALRWEDVDLEDGHLEINNNLVMVKGSEVSQEIKNKRMTQLHETFFLGDPKTEKSKRVVMLPKDTVLLLKEHKHRQQSDDKWPHIEYKQVKGYKYPQAKEIYGKTWIDLGLVFPSKTGAPLNPSNLRWVFYDLIEKSNVKRIKWHDLRDSHVMFLLLQGVDIVHISERLGHSRVSTTLDHYTQVFPHLKKKIALTLEEMLKI